MASAHSPRNCHDCASCESRLDGIFATLDGEALERLNRSKVSHAYRCGQALFYEGNPVVGVFCVRSGLVKVYKSAPRARRHILYLAEPGDVLGVESLLTGELYSATAEMLEDGIVCQIARDELQRLLTARPDLVQALARALASQLTRSEGERADLAASGVRERLAKTLLALATRFGAGSGEKSIGLKLSREDLAEMIGASTETTIRQLAQFREHGLVSLSGRTILLEDPEKLARLARLPVGPTS